jgi:hypothetical protein
MKRLVNIGQFKVFLDRARMYVGYIQFFILLAVFMRPYSETKFGAWFYSHKLLTVPGVIISFILLSVLIGYLDKKFIRPGEQFELASTNPKWTRLFEELKELDDKISVHNKEVQK